MTPVPTIDCQARTADDEGVEAFLDIVHGRLADPVLLVVVALSSLALLTGLVARVAEVAELTCSGVRRTPTWPRPPRPAARRSPPPLTVSIDPFRHSVASSP